MTKIIDEVSYRSQGKGVHEADDMARLWLDIPIRELLRFKSHLSKFNKTLAYQTKCNKGRKK